MNDFWIELLRRIPPKHHDNLGLVTTTGQEIFVQQFYRFDPQFMVMRARLSGSTEGSRVIMLPYSHIDYVSFVKVLPETEVQNIFGSDGAYVAPAAPAPAPAAETADKSVPEQAPEGEAAEVTVTSPTPAPATSGPGVAPMTVGPGSTMQTAPLSARSPAANGAAQANGDAGEKVDPSKVSKTLLLARLRERMNQKSR